MTDHCVIQADFSSFRPVAGRKCLQLVFEIPIERGEEALRMLGMPLPGENRWCAIALLDTKLVREPASQQDPITNGEREVSGSASTSQAEGGSPKKSWGEMKRSQQAWLLCEDAAFWSYFGIQIGETIIDTARTTATKLRLHFKISTRSELDKPENHARWDEFVALYNLHRERHK